MVDYNCGFLIHYFIFYLTKLIRFFLYIDDKYLATKCSIIATGYIHRVTRRTLDMGVLGNTLVDKKKTLRFVNFSLNPQSQMGSKIFLRDYLNRVIVITDSINHYSVYQIMKKGCIKNIDLSKKQAYE